jgi:RND family efflux transporter MFP subunit
MIRTLLGVALFFGACLGLTGCGASREAPQRPPLTVTVSEPLQRKVTDYAEYTGRTAAVDSVRVVARVTGYLKTIYFTEGADVDKGAELYEIDPRPYKAAADAAEAQVDQNVAGLKLAQQNNARFQKLAKDQKGAVTQLQLDQYQAQEDQAVAALNQSKANLVTAKLNLGWTKVTAPVKGRISRLLVTQGNLITADQTVLTTIVSQDPIWAEFDVDEPTVLRVKQFIRDGLVTGYKEAKYPVYLGLSNERDPTTRYQLYPHLGYIDFVNNQLDQATATLLVRGLFANPQPRLGDRLLTPRMFVRIRVPVSPSTEALLVTAAAIGEDQNLKYLYVVDKDNKVVRHAVELGSQQDGLQVITKGLKPRERVIVSGIQRVQRGAVVKPRLVPMPIPTRESQAENPKPVLKNPIPQPKK